MGRPRVLACEACLSGNGPKSGPCKECKRVKGRAYYSRNAETLVAKAKEWHAANRAAANQRQREYYHEHREEHLQASTAYAKAHPEVNRLSTAKYRASGRSKVVKRDWRLNNPEKQKAQGAADRERRRESGKDTLSVADRKKLCEKYGGKCLCCGRTDVPLQADHVIPVAAGGSHDLSNRQPLCDKCNKQKWTKHTDYRP